MFSFNAIPLSKNKSFVLLLFSLWYSTKTKNNSPQFIFQDTAIVCHNSTISLPFTATDQDGDSLSYSFTNGLNVSNASQNTFTNTPSSPPYPSLTYLTSYSGQQRLGSGVTIDPVTGLISGTTPSATGEIPLSVMERQQH